MVGPSVDLILLRGLLPDLALRQGSLVTGRVIDARTIVLEGVRMQAQLPPDVQPGQRLRMRIEQSGPERLQLRVVEVLADPATARAARAAGAPPAAAERTDDAQIPVQAFAMALPGGVEARVYVTEHFGDEGAGEAAGAPVVIRYDSPTVGRLDVRLDRLSAAVHVSAGEPADRVAEAAGALREALGRVQGRDVQVTVHPRLETYDARA